MITERNYLEVYTYDRWNANLLPEFRTGQTFTPSSLQIKQGKTSRPSLLTEAELINLMDNSGIGITFSTHRRLQELMLRFMSISRKSWSENTPSKITSAVLCRRFSGYRLSRRTVTWRLSCHWPSPTLGAWFSLISLTYRSADGIKDERRL